VSIFGSNDLGLQINADHTWEKIFGTIDSPELASGPLSKGTWTASEEGAGSGIYELTFVVSGPRYDYETPYLTPDDQHMHLADGFFWDDYVRWAP